jgi:hypothetical protein
MKKRILRAALAAGVSLALAVTPALAVAEAGNDTTGASSVNNTSVTTTRVVTITNTNSSSVSNKVSSWVNSGYNSASGNTGDGTIGTGGASWGGSFSTNANCNEADVMMDMDGDPSATNKTTGASSVNDALVDVNNTVTLTNENNSTVGNELDVDVDSGNNNADSNTGSGSVDTGNAGASGSVRTETNANTAQVSGGSSSEHSTSNDTTGFGSDNDAVVDLDNLTTFSNLNNSDIGNFLDVWVDSGGNSASMNTGDGGVTTGDASVNPAGIDVLSLANGNFANIAGGVGETTGGASNKTTGASSVNDALVDVDNVVNLINDNWGFIDNDVLASAISGQNTADSNTGSASIGTGASSTDVGVGNVLNTNQASVGSNPDPLGSSGAASNEVTGEASINDAAVNTANTLGVTNQNNVPGTGSYGVDNNVTADAFSGYNSADSNTGDSDTTTGTSDVDVGLATDQNSNVTYFAGFGANNDSMWNKTTGFGSINNAAVTHTDTVVVGVDSWGWIENIFDDEANSGNNTADNNTGSSSITTDAAGLTESTDDSQNYNYFGPAIP